MTDSPLAKATVFVVDDDQAMRNSLKWLIESVGVGVESFASADEFLAQYYPGRAGCLVLDVRMPDSDGLNVLGTGATTPPHQVAQPAAEKAGAVIALAGLIEVHDSQYVTGR